jgi:glutaredoxin
MQHRIAIRVVCIAALLACLGAQAQSNVYRWVDKDGKVHFSDTPPPPEAKDATQKRMGNAGPADENQMPYATQMAAKSSPVTLYTSNDCGDLCAKGRDLLSRRGIPYAEKNAEKNADDAESLKKLVGSFQVPVLLVGERTVKGFDESSWQAALDTAGYAKTRLPGQAGPRPQ